MKTAMTDEEKRIAIAEYCGWRDAFPENKSPHPKTREGGILLPYLWIHEPTGKRVAILPDFLNSLEAMHEAEETLIEKTRERYASYLSGILSSSELLYHSCCNAYAETLAFKLLHATARQRAEAFLKTIQQP